MNWQALDAADGAGDRQDEPLTLQSMGAIVALCGLIVGEERRIFCSDVRRNNGTQFFVLRKPCKASRR